MKNQKPLLSSQFVESVFTPFSLVLISIVAIIAVAVALFQVNRGPLAPNAPQSQPQAADLTSNTCALTFTVAALPTATPIPLIDLELQKTVNDSSVNVNDQVVFTVSVFNNSAVNATGVQVSDVIPAGFQLSLASPGRGTFDTNTRVWDIGNIAAGETVSMTLTGTITATGPVTNYAQVSDADQTDVDSVPNNGPQVDEDDDDSVTVNSNATGIDLELTKDHGAQVPTLGGNLTFFIRLLNKGPQTATGVTVGDILPAGLDFVSATPQAGTTFDSTTGTWTVPSLAPDTTITLSITVTVNRTGTTVNYAQVTDADQPDVDSTPNDGPQNPDDDDDDDDTIVVNPVATATPTNTPVIVSGTVRPSNTPTPTNTPAPSADLRLNKSVSNSTPKVGDEITYTVEVYNAGPNNTTNVTVREPLAGGLTYISSTASQGSYNVNTGIWTIGTINVNETKTLNIKVRVNVNSAITNISQVQTSDLPDPNSTPGNNNPNENDQDTVTTNPVVQGADLSLTKRVNNSTPKRGENVVYTIEVRNNGPQQADNVTVKDLLPSGTTLVYANPSQGSYDSGTGIWTIGSMTKDFTVRMEFTVRIDRDGAITNIAQVQSSSQPDPDSTPGNNNPNEDDQDDASVNTSTAPVLPRAGNTSRTTLFVIATGVIVLIIGAMGLLLLL